MLQSEEQAPDVLNAQGRFSPGKCHSRNEFWRLILRMTTALQTWVAALENNIIAESLLLKTELKEDDFVRHVSFFGRDAPKNAAQPEAR